MVVEVFEALLIVMIVISTVIIPKKRRMDNWEQLEPKNGPAARETHGIWLLGLK